MLRAVAAGTGSGGAGGDVVGPASSTDNAIARFEGTTGKLLQNSSGAIISDNFSIALTGATITASDPNTFAQTWNNAGVTFNLLSIEATDTASGAASLLQRWRVGGANVAALDKAGNLAVVKATVNGGTVTASSAALSVNQTWNNGAVAFTSAVVNVTNTASDAASSLLDLQVASASVFSVSPAGNVRLANGTNALPALAFASDPDLGVYRVGANQLGVTANTSVNFLNNTGGQYFSAQAGGLLAMTVNAATLQFGASNDAVLNRDAADTWGQRRTTNSQTYNLYDTFTSTTDYHRVAIKTARATLASVSGATVTATAIIPDGAVVVGVTTKVTVALGGGGGTTGYQVGTVADPDRWGVAATITSGTSTDNTNWTAGTIECFTAASDVVITAVGGNFNGTGTIYVSVQYLIGQAD